MINLIAVLVWLVAGAAYGQVIVNYIEPAVNADQSPLQDLVACTISFQHQISGATVSTTVMANIPQGGETRTADFTGMGVEGGWDATGTCVDTDGNSSGVSNLVAYSFPGIGPGPPQLLPQL